MPNPLRLLLLSLLVPALVHLLGGMTWAPVLLFAAFVSYPIMVAAVCAFVFPLHCLFSRQQVEARRQLLFVLPLGVLGGSAVYLALAAPNLAASGAISSRLALEYSLIGLLTALFCWVLYNWGPLRLTR